MLRTAIISLLFCTAFSITASACRMPPSQEQWEVRLRELIKSADHIFIGQVQRITRRRWGPDDLKDNYLNRWLKWKSEGRKIPDYIQNMIDFSDATIRLEVSIALKKTGIDDTSRTVVPIDLLRPFSQAGHGPCLNFPRTCPWDIKAGESLAVAVEKQDSQPFKATYCIRTNLPLRTEREKILRLRDTTSVDDMIWPYVLAEESRLKKTIQKKSK